MDLILINHAIVTPNYGRGFGCGSGRRSGNRGRGGHYSNFQYQVCYKFGHTALVCHFRFDQGYQPNSSLSLQDPTSQGNLQ